MRVHRLLRVSDGFLGKLSPMIRRLFVRAVGIMCHRCCQLVQTCYGWLYLGAESGECHSDADDE